MLVALVGHLSRVFLFVQGTFFQQVLGLGIFHLTGKRDPGAGHAGVFDGGVAGNPPVLSGLTGRDHGRAKRFGRRFVVVRIVRIR